MKKSLIALAIASAVSAPAFAATSNVDVYGVLNLSVYFVDPDVTSRDQQHQRHFQRQPHRLQGRGRSGWRPDRNLADRIRRQR